MPLREQLTDDLKDAMRQGDALRRTTIRSLQSAIQSRELARRMEIIDRIRADRKAKGLNLEDAEQNEKEVMLAYTPDEMSESDVIQVLAKQAQQRRDSIESFKGADRQDLVDKEQSELKIIAAYLPEQMSEDEVKVLVKQALADSGATGPQDMGKVMKELMPKTRGKADGKMVSSLVNEALRGMA